MKRILLLIGVAGASLLLAGCPKKPTTVETPPGGEAVGGTAGAVTGAEAGAGTPQPLPGDGGAAGGGPGAEGAPEMVIYFDFDSAEIRSEYAPTIAALARELGSRAAVRIRLEGHTDERGSPEYNVALGERRAQAVRRALALQGAPDGQIATVSFGEERPAAEGQSEEAWAQNRRVEIVATGGR